MKVSLSLCFKTDRKAVTFPTPCANQTSRNPNDVLIRVDNSREAFTKCQQELYFSPSDEWFVPYFDNLVSPRTDSFHRLKDERNTDRRQVTKVTICAVGLSVRPYLI